MTLMQEFCDIYISSTFKYRETSSISRTKSQSLKYYILADMP